ncbi:MULTISPECIES: hypothetical protein [Pseudomonas]|uniref:hypothetical protein n=1 Tax=Pseudomonas TaxID=286 RepID=UPI001049D06B|nr:MULTISPECIES: hypothetical protein [Pseudomonas]QNL88907.1 Uncharacterized protein PPKH_3493 [Pseudomonas putida]TCT93308.1 hypothetical protein EC913_116127 [Pseudomonas sp. LP_4_YM]
MTAFHLKQCPFCGQVPELIDDRVQFFVRCKNHQPPWPLVYGQSMRHLDHINDDEEAEKAFDAVDWSSVEKSAVDAWNVWAESQEKH